MSGAFANDYLKSKQSLVAKYMQNVKRAQAEAGENWSNAWHFIESAQRRMDELVDGLSAEQTAAVQQRLNELERLDIWPGGNESDDEEVWLARVRRIWGGEGGALSAANLRGIV